MCSAHIADLHAAFNLALVSNPIPISHYESYQKEFIFCTLGKEEILSLENTRLAKWNLTPIVLVANKNWRTETHNKKWSYQKHQFLFLEHLKEMTSPSVIWQWCNNAIWYEKHLKVQSFTVACCIANWPRILHYNSMSQ